MGLHTVLKVFSRIFQMNGQGGRYIVSSSFSHFPFSFFSPTNGFFFFKLCPLFSFFELIPNNLLFFKKNVSRQYGVKPKE